MSNDPSLFDLDRRHIWRPFTQAATAQPPLMAQSARGLRVRDAEGREYLDLVSSWWVNLHGHGHPKIAQAIAEQAARLEQVIFAEFTHEPAIRLAARLAELLPGDLERVFYSDDGSTAVEVALKMAHQYWANKGETRTTYIGFDGGYHGDTVGAMSLGRSSSYFAPWSNMLFPVHVAPFPATWDGDTDIEDKEAQALDALDALLAQHAVAAAIAEPLVQGAAGMRVCRPQFLAAVAQRVHAAGSLLILDEVMTGFGRTGPLFACEAAGIVPDFICLSKGLTGGFLPMAATVTRPHIYDAFLDRDIARAFLHGHSYTANPLGCAAGLASLDLLLDPACTQARAMIAQTHRTGLGIVSSQGLAVRTRSQGTIAAFDVETRPDAPEGVIGSALKKAFRARGLILRPLGRTLYVLPPYCITHEELTDVWQQIAQVVAEI